MSDPLTPRRRSKRGRTEEDPFSPSHADGVEEPVTRKSNIISRKYCTALPSTWGWAQMFFEESYSVFWFNWWPASLHFIMICKVVFKSFPANFRLLDYKVLNLVSFWLIMLFFIMNKDNPSM